MLQLHLGLTVGPRRQINGNFNDTQAAPVHQRQAFEEEFVISAFETVDQILRYSVQSVDSKSSTRVIRQRQEKPGQEMTQMGKTLSKWIPFFQTVVTGKTSSDND